MSRTPDHDVMHCDYDPECEWSVEHFDSDWGIYWAVNRLIEHGQAEHDELTEESQ